MVYACVCSSLSCAAFADFVGDYSLPVAISKLKLTDDNKHLHVAALSGSQNQPTGLADSHFRKIMSWVLATSNTELAKRVLGVELVHNQNHFSGFCVSIDNLLGRVNSPAFQTNLRAAELDDESKLTDDVIQDRVRRRQSVLDHFATLTRQVTHAHAGSGINIVRAWHGTTKDVASSVIRNGFAALANLDAGWYGKGVYFSSSAQYASQYCKGKKDPCLILCYLLTPSPYPIIEEDAPRSLDMSEDHKFRFFAKGAHSKFFCHYARVGPCEPGPGCMDFRPPRAGTHDEAPFDEIVIFQEAHILPQAIVYLNE